MLGVLKNLFGSKVDLKEKIDQGATILDVRSKGEYASGHVKGSVNIPLDLVSSNIDKIKNMKQPIITCCASGIRSGSAKNILKSNNIEAYNGGGWASVNKLI